MRPLEHRCGHKGYYGGNNGMKPITVLSLFDGMSCGQLALKKLGIPVERYYASEVDKYAIKQTQHNFPDTVQLGDVRGIKGRDLPPVELLLVSFMEIE